MNWSFKELVRDALVRVPEITCEELHSQLGRGIVLDVREAAETRGVSLPDAVFLPRGVVEKHIQDLVTDKTTRVFVYSATGNRSALVCDVMKKMGYADVHSLAGGLERWQHLGLPVSGGAAVCRLPGSKLDWDAVRHEFAIVGRHVPVLGSRGSTLRGRGR